MRPTTKTIPAYYRQYHIPGQPSHYSVKKNAIFISNANSLKHELSKFLACYMIKKYSDVKFTKELIEGINGLANIFNIIFKDWKESHSEFITEACPNENKDRRVDIVNLINNDRIEIETDHRIKKADDGKNVVTIYV